jgi:hypothetical protein
MRKLALVFVLAVFAPSLVLAWLAVRSLRDQNFLIERQRSLLLQAVSDRKAQQVQGALLELQRDFSSTVASLFMGNEPVGAARSFDSIIGKHWTMAEAGFAVTTTGDILSPAPYSRQEARAFLEDNSRFLANRESVEVYLNPKQYGNNLLAEQQAAPMQQPQTDAKDLERNTLTGKPLQTRNVSPQQQFKGRFQGEDYPSISRLAASETEFRQLVGQNNEGMLARFVDNKLNVLVWYRPPASSNIIVGAKLALPRLLEALAPIISDVEPDLRNEVCLALLDDTGKPALRSHPDFEAPWKRPFVARRSERSCRTGRPLCTC